MGKSKTLVVLDDDPTGTQTVHDVEVLTEWLVLHAFSINSEFIVLTQIYNDPRKSRHVATC